MSSFKSYETKSLSPNKYFFFFCLNYFIFAGVVLRKPLCLRSHKYMNEMIAVWKRRYLETKWIPIANNVTQWKWKSRLCKTYEEEIFADEISRILIELQY